MPLRPPRRRSPFVAAAGSGLLVVGLALGQGVSASSAGAAAPASGSATAEKVIVLLRDQLASTPATRQGMAARTSRAMQGQDAVLRGLPGAAPSHVRHFALANAFAATMTVAQADALRANPAVARVVKDAAIPMGKPVQATGKSGSAATPHGVSGPSSDPDPVCPTDPAQAADRARGAALHAR